MTYRLWYIITWPSAITASILLLDVVFTDLGRWLKMPWMHVKLGFVFVLIPCKMPSNIQAIAE
jgi:putative membrane protein